MVVGEQGGATARQRERWGDWLSLRARLLALVALAVVPAIAVEIHGARELRLEREQQIAQEGTRLVSLVVAEQQRINEGARQMLVALSQSTSVRGGDWAACSDLAARIHGRVPGYLNLGVATASGDLLCSALPIPPNRDMRRRDFLADMTAEGDLLVGRYHVGLITGEKALTIALPARGQNGDIDYVAWANLDLTWLARHFADRFTTRNLTMLMADAAGTILVRLPDNDLWAGKPIGDVYMPMVRAANNGVADITGVDGDERIVAYAPATTEPKGIYVGVGLAKAPYLAAIAATTRQNIGFISLSFALALIAAWLGGSVFIRRPVERLLAAAGRWQSGDYAARVGEGGGQSEIGRLGQAFDAMAAAVETRQRDRDAAEKALVELNAQLEQRVKSEVAQREQAQQALAQAQKMDALGQLTGGVAHDFNNLLAAIVGNLDLLGLRVGDDKSRQLVGNAIGAANRGTKLIDQLLAFSRDRQLELQPFDANALVKGMDDLLDRSIGPAITVAFSLGKNLWPATADASQVEVALLNIAINARDAMPLGGTLLVETANVAAGDRRLPAGLDGDFVMIAISDTGTGMTDAVKARAFEPFYTTKEVGKGTGLGLSMVYGVAKQSGGLAAIESAVGKGTTVALFLPRSAQGAAPAAAAPASPMQERARGAGKLMLVDDDPDVRAVTVAGLTEAGFDVVEFDSGLAAVARFDEHRDVQLLVTDYAMPAMNGIELIQRLRERMPLLPAIVITGYANPVAALVVPDDLTVLRKPYRVTELVACVMAALAAQEGARKVVPLAKPAP